MAINKEMVRQVAALARLDLEGVDVDRLTAEMNDIIALVEKLKGADVEGIPATAHVRPRALPLREDSPKPGLTADQALANAPKRQGDFVLVPRVVQEGGST